MFTDEEKFRFDLQGFIVLPGVLTRTECTLLSELSDAAWPRQPGDGAFRRTEAISRWGGEFLNLIDHLVCCHISLNSLGLASRRS